jgi:hypothetical protein
MSAFRKKLLLAVLVAALGTLAATVPALAYTVGIEGCNHNETFLNSLD